MEVDPEGNLVPRLATGWRWLDDRTCEVMLRQGVAVQNGEVFEPRSLSSTGKSRQARHKGELWNANSPLSSVPMSKVTAA